MDLIRHEWRIVGRTAIGAPLVILAIFLGLAGIAAWTQIASGHSPTRPVNALLLAVLEIGLPLAAALVAATLAADDPAAELQASYPPGYRARALARLTRALAASAALSAAANLVFAAAGALHPGEPAAAEPLIWLAPTAALSPWSVSARPTAAASGPWMASTWRSPPACSGSLARTAPARRP